MQVKDPATLECSQCTNERVFNILGIDRIGDTHNWDVLIQCHYCLVAVNYRFTGFAFYSRLLKHVKSMISEQKNKERPSSYEEWDYRTGRIIRTTHKQGLWEVLR